MQEVVTCDRLHNRVRQSLSQVSQLVSKLHLENPSMVHAANEHVASARKSTTFIIFNRAIHIHGSNSWAHPVPDRGSAGPGHSPGFFYII